MKTKITYSSLSLLETSVPNANIQPCTNIVMKKPKRIYDVFLDVLLNLQKHYKNILAPQKPKSQELPNVPCKIKIRIDFYLPWDDGCSSK